MTSNNTHHRPPGDEPADAEGLPPSEDGPAPDDQTPDEPVHGSEDTPLAQDLSSDLPVAEPVTPEPVPVAKPVPIPVAEEVAPPKPKGKPGPHAKPKAAAPKTPAPKRPAAPAPPPDESEPPSDESEPPPDESEPPSDESEPPSDEGQPPKKHRGRRILLVVAAVIILLVALVPTILSTGTVLTYVLEAANARLPVRVRADGWSLSWFGSQQVAALSVQMPDGVRVATVGQASLDQGLFTILADRGRMGPIRVEDAEVWVEGLRQAVETFRASEGAAAAWSPEPGVSLPESPPPAEPPPSRPPAEPPPPAAPAPVLPAPPVVIPDSVTVDGLVVHARAATVRVAAARFEKGEEADSLKADLHLRHGETAGTAAVDLTLTGLSSEWQGPEAIGVNGTVACTDLPVAALWAVAAELGVPLDGAGAVTAKVAFSRGRSGNVAVQVTRFTATDLSVTGDLLTGDEPTMESLTLTADAAYADGLITVNALDLAAPVATTEARGTFALTAADAARPTGTGSATLTLQIGLLARMLPKTLGLHKDLTVETGTLQVTVAAASDAKRSQLTFEALLEGVRGTRGGHSVALSPVRVVADLERDHAPASDEQPPADDWLTLAESLRVNDLTATAAAGTVKAAGRMEAFTLDAQIDLAKATDEVGRFVDLEGRGAEGAAVIGVKTEGTPRSGIRAAVTSEFKDLVLHLGGGGRIAEPQATLTATGRATFDDRHRLSDVALDALDLEAATASLAAKGFIQRTLKSWQFSSTVGGNGTIANLGGLMAVILPLFQDDTPQKKADKGDAGWRETLLQYAHRASGRGGKPAGGRWQLKARAGGDIDQAVAVKADAAVADLVWPPEEPSAKPLRIADGTFHADLLYHLGGEAGKVTIHSLEATVPGASAVVKGPAKVAVDGTGALDGNLDVVVAAALPAFARTIAPLGLLPEEATFGGDVTVRLTASPATDGRTIAKAKLTVVGEKVDVAWPDGRGFSDPLLRLTAAADLLRDAGEAASEDALALADAADALAAVDVTDWSLATVAGTLKGTAGINRAKTGWHWQVTAGGDGAIRPLTQTVARLRGRPAGQLRGLWNLKAAYDSRTHELTATAHATNLTVPQEGDKPLPDLRLENIHLETTAAYTDAGLLRIDTADLTGPGITLKARGTVRLPSDDAGATADGTVTAKADLAPFSQVLAPFGMLPEGMHLAGTAAFDGKVASHADGFGGDGVLDVTHLDLRAPESKTVIQEPQVHLPITFKYDTAKRRWDVSTEAMKAETATGTWRVSVTETDADPLLAVTCGVTLDAERVRAMLGERLPATVRLSGPWRLVADVAGPLPGDGPWHRRIARLEGGGRLDVKRFEYETLTGGDGSVAWRIGQKQIRLSPDPRNPSRLALAGGHVNVGGSIDLSQETPRLVIARRLQVLDGIPLEGQQVQDYLRYASPVLAASISAKGNLSLALDRLVVPLGDDPREANLPEEKRTPIATRVAAAGAYRIDDFQTELIGPLGKMLKAAGGPAQTVVQPFGPVKVVMERGLLQITEHDLQYAAGVTLRFGGTIGVDKRMNVIIGVPLTPELLARYKVSATAMPYLKDIVIAVPLTGTIDKPRLDTNAFTKRMADIAMEAIKRRAIEGLGDWLKDAFKKK